ncbi:MAG TPA: Hsp20/alpha crystallin family protein [Sedimenticola sp.]|nr:Hsp20/alpha crystallin family protein [Sedimenticola sp.]
MSTLQQLRRGVNRAFESIHEGWLQLRERAANALTRFSPTRSDPESAEQQLEIASPRWGLLAAEVREEDDRIKVRLEIPGMNKGDFSISVYDDVLVVKGEKHIEREEKRGRYHLMERAYGRFERAIPLSCPVDEKGASASYKRGVLTITLPKQARATRRRIAVNSG